MNSPDAQWLGRNFGRDFMKAAVIRYLNILLTEVREGNLLFGEDEQRETKRLLLQSIIKHVETM